MSSSQVSNISSPNGKQHQKQQSRKKGSPDRSIMITRLISLQVLLLALILHFLVAFVTGNWTAGQNGISPMTWLASLGLPTLLASREWNVGAVGFSGLLAILQIGFILILADYSFFTAFAAHVIISEPSPSPASKSESSSHHKSYTSIFSELLLGLYVTSIHILEYGMGSPAKTLDFGVEFLHSWLSVIFMGSLCVVIGGNFVSTMCKSMSKGAIIGTGFYIGHLLSGRTDLSPFTTLKMGSVGGLLAACTSSAIQIFVWGGVNSGSKSQKSLKSSTSKSGEDFGLHILTTLLTGMMLPRVLMIIESNYVA